MNALAIQGDKRSLGVLDRITGNDLFVLLRALTLIAMLPATAIASVVATIGLFVAGSDFSRDGGFVYTLAAAGGLLGCIGLISCPRSGPGVGRLPIRLPHYLIVIGIVTALSILLPISGWLISTLLGDGRFDEFEWLGLCLALALSILVVDGLARLARSDTLPLIFLGIALCLVTATLVMTHGYANFF